MSCSWRVPSRYKGVLGLRFVSRGVGRNFGQPAARNSQPLNIDRSVACSFLGRFCLHDHSEKVAMIKFDVMHLLGVIKERTSPDAFQPLIDIGNCTSKFIPAMSCSTLLVSASQSSREVSHPEGNHFSRHSARYFSCLSENHLVTVRAEYTKHQRGGCSTFSLAYETRAFAARRHLVDDWPFFKVQGRRRRWCVTV